MNVTPLNPQPLLWVNHDAKNRKARPHRRVVFTHVQNSWKKWKRKEDALTLRKSAKLPVATLENAVQSSIIQSRDGDGDEVECQNYTLVKISSKDKECPKHELGSIFTGARPQTILRKGNSDPFQAFAIPIDARLADLLAYTRDKYLPEIFTHVNAPDVQAAVVGAFAETITFLHDECTAYGHVVKVAAVMPKGSIAPELASQIPVFKLKGLASLRKKVTNSASLLDARTSASMLLFLTAELYEGNLEATATHARMIAHLLQTQIIPLNFLFLFSALYDDTQRACFALSRPSFDVKTWIPQQLGRLGVTGVEKIASQVVAELCGPVDASIKSSSMRAIIAEANSCSAIALLTSKEKHEITDNQATFRFGCRRLACMGSIINHYIDSRERTRQMKSKDPEVVRNARMEAQVCLASLYLMRHEAKMDMFWIKNSFGVFTENRNILASLQDLLQEDDCLDQAIYARARLFALFAGAWAAYANLGSGALHELVGNEWFIAEFAAQALLMRLWSWESVEAVLKGFHFLGLLQPSGSTFYSCMY